MISYPADKRERERERESTSGKFYETNKSGRN